MAISWCRRLVVDEIWLKAYIKALRARRWRPLFRAAWAQRMARWCQKKGEKWGRTAWKLAMKCHWYWHILAIFEQFEPCNVDMPGLRRNWENQVFFGSFQATSILVEIHPSNLDENYVAQWLDLCQLRDPKPPDAAPIGFNVFSDLLLFEIRLTLGKQT